MCYVFINNILDEFRVNPNPGWSSTGPVYHKDRVRVRVRVEFRVSAFQLVYI